MSVSSIKNSKGRATLALVRPQARHDDHKPRYFINPTKPEAQLSCVKLSSYRTENTARRYYKDKRINAVRGVIRCFALRIIKNRQVSLRKINSYCLLRQMCQILSTWL